jgi:peptidoglycan/LPS O-acetylase OafA/YrhL
VRSSNRPYLYPVDHLRAFAVVLVLLYHSTQVISQAADPENGWSSTRWLHSDNPLVTVLFEGHTGVALFMVLSGFIFTTGTLDKDVAYWPFLRNRLLRIYPLYVLILMVGVTASTQAFDLGTFLRALLPLGSFGPNIIGGPWGGMFWAVAVEMQFYLLFPLLLRLLQRFGPLALVRLLVAVAVLRGMAWVLSPGALDMRELTYFSLVGRIDQFLLGMIAGWWFLRRPSRRVAAVALLGGVATLLVVLRIFNELEGMRTGAWWRVAWVDVEGLAWAAVVVGYTVLLADRSGRLSRAVAAVGERSYSMYLLHFVIVVSVAAHPGWWIQVGGPVSTALVTGLVVVLPASMLVSALTFAAIERPFLEMRGNYVRPREVPVAAPSPRQPQEVTAPDRG